MQEADHILKETQKKNYDHRHRVRTLPPIEKKTKVWIDTPTSQQKGEIEEQIDRSYIVSTSSGSK